MSGWDPSAADLVELLAHAARGPRREGVYAVWLTLRVAQDLQLEPPPVERALRRRLGALEQRLSSLTIPPPLRRALTGALAQMRDPPASATAAVTTALVLTQLVAPARECLGKDAGDALARAARAARSR